MYPCLFTFKFRTILRNLLLESNDNCLIFKNVQLVFCLKLKLLNSRIIGIQTLFSLLYETLSILSQPYMHNFDPFHRLN